MTSAELLDRLVTLFPEFGPHWDAKNYGSFTLHGVFEVFTGFFRARHAALPPEGVAALGAFVSECMAPDNDSPLDNAAATCFVESIAGEPCDRELAPHLTGPARRYWLAWGGQDAESGAATDALRFQEIMTASGGQTGKPSRELVAFLREKGVSEPAIEYLSGYVLKKASGVSAIDFYAEDGWIGANAEDFVSIAIRDGLLIVGTCPNGDPVAVDVREQVGAAGYIGNETMWQAGNVREVFKVLSPGLGALAAGLDEGTMPLDYYEATQRG